MSYHIKIIGAHTQLSDHLYTQDTLRILLSKYCRAHLRSAHHTDHKTYTQHERWVSRINRIFHSACIKKRHLLLTPEQLLSGDTPSIDVNIDTTKNLLLQQIQLGVNEICRKLRLRTTDINCVISTSGIYTIPNIGFDILNTMEFNCTIQHKHTAGLASSGGARCLIDAYHYLQLNPSHCVLTICAESGSHGWLGAIKHSIDTTLHNRNNTDDQLNKELFFNDIVVSAIMGDGVGLCILAGADHPLSHRTDYKKTPINIINTLSTYLPNTQHVIQRIATPYGYHTRLDSNLPITVVPPLSEHIKQFIKLNNITADQLGFYVIHPGGSKVLRGVEQQFNIPSAINTTNINHTISASPTLRHSWSSMWSMGNCSSASIIDVLRRTLSDPSCHGYGVAFAVGPGIVGETLLLHR